MTAFSITEQALRRDIALHLSQQFMPDVTLPWSAPRIADAASDAARAWPFELTVRLPLSFCCALLNNNMVIYLAFCDTADAALTPWTLGQAASAEQKPGPPCVSTAASSACTPIAIIVCDVADAIASSTSNLHPRSVHVNNALHGRPGKALPQQKIT